MIQNTNNEYQYKDSTIESLYQVYKNANNTLDEVICLIRDLSGRRACDLISEFADRMYEENKQKENENNEY